MKIAILTNEYPPHIYGGAGVHVDYLVRELAALDGGRHSITVLCFGDQQERWGNLRVSGVTPAFAFPACVPQHHKLLATLYRNLMMVGELTEAEIVHCHTWYTHLAGCLVKKLLGAKLVLTTHSLEPQRPWKAEQLGAGYQVSSWVEKTAYQNADGVIAVSRAMKRDVRQSYKVAAEKIRIIPNGLDTGHYRPTFNPEVVAAYGLNPDRPYILFVGRVSRQKGISHLLEAVPYLDADTQVLLCAADPDTPELGQEMAAKLESLRDGSNRRIIWVSRFVPREDLICLYSHAAVFVCPSIYEPFGIINLEAMACGTPVVASAVGGIKEVVRHRETGLLVPLDPVSATNPEPKEPEVFARRLAEAVKSLLANPDRRQAMGAKARKLVEERYSWPSIARRTYEFYQELLRT